MALVVGEVDALLGLRRAAVPVALRAGDEAGDERGRPETGGILRQRASCAVFAGTTTARVSAGSGARR